MANLRLAKIYVYIYNVFRLRLLIYIYKKIRLDFSIVVANRYKFSDIVMMFIAFAKCAFLLNIHICVCKEFGHRQIYDTKIRN